MDFTYQLQEEAKQGLNYQKVKSVLEFSGKLLS